MKAGVGRLDWDIDLDQKRLVGTQIEHSAGIDVGALTAACREIGLRGIVESVARHERSTIAVAVAVCLQDEVIELVPEFHLVLDDFADAAHLRGRASRVDRRRMCALPADLDYL